VIVSHLLLYTFHDNHSKERVGQQQTNVQEVTASIPTFKITSALCLLRDHLRGVSVYAGIGEERPFTWKDAVLVNVEAASENVPFLPITCLDRRALCLTLLISQCHCGIGLLALADVLLFRASIDWVFTASC
jgi:hypothetical protein